MSKVVGDRDASELIRANQKTKAISGTSGGNLVDQAQELFLEGVMHGLGNPNPKPKPNSNPHAWFR